MQASKDVIPQKGKDYGSKTDDEQDSSPAATPASHQSCMEVAGQPGRGRRFPGVQPVAPRISLRTMTSVIRESDHNSTVLIHPYLRFPFFPTDRTGLEQVSKAAKPMVKRRN